MERWTNDGIRIDFPVPSGIQRVMDELEKADAEKDFGRWFNYVDFLDVACKSAFSKNQITQKQWNVICSKYTLDRCLGEE